MQSDSNINPKVFKSLIKSFGLISSIAVAIDGSTKYFLGFVLIAYLLLKLRLVALTSSITNNFSNVFK